MPPNFSLLTEKYSRAEHAFIIQLLVLFPSTDELDYFCLIIVCSLLLFTCSHFSNLIINLHKNDIISTFYFYLFIHCFVHPSIHLLFLRSKPQLSANFSPHLAHRLSTKWWARWSWWKWTRTVWHQSRGWTRSSVKWIKTMTTRSRWRSSKRRQRATRPSCSCCSVTCRSEPSLLPPLPVCIHTLWTAAHVLMSH